MKPESKAVLHILRQPGALNTRMHDHIAPRWERASRPRASVQSPIKLGLLRRLHSRFFTVLENLKAYLFKETALTNCSSIIYNHPKLETTQISLY